MEKCKLRSHHRDWKHGGECVERSLTPKQNKNEPRRKSLLRETTRVRLSHTTFPPPPPPLSLLSLIFAPTHLLTFLLHFVQVQQIKTNLIPAAALSVLPPLSGGSGSGVRLSITVSLLHQHQIGLQPAWHSAASQGDWTPARLPRTNLPPIHNSTICR